MASEGLRQGAAVVISAGKMNRTVKVRMMRREWDSHLRKHYYTPYKMLVHDPRNSVNEGDVITCAYERHGQRVRHVVSSILAPFATPVEERPPIPTFEERALSRDDKYRKFNERRAARGNATAIEILKQRGWSLTASPEEVLASSGTQANSKGETMEHGRTVQPDGTHKYGARGEGGINKEAWNNKQKAMDLHERGLQHEAEREAVMKEDSPAR